MVLVLDAVQDPGNVGTMLRSALGLGAAGVVALKGTAELTNPKVLRGSMGAAFRLPAVSADADALLAWAAERGVEIWVAAADGEPVGGRGGRGALAARAGAGQRRRRRERHDRRGGATPGFHPLASGVESLNVAVAAGILLHEVTRDA